MGAIPPTRVDGVCAFFCIHIKLSVENYKQKKYPASFGLDHEEHRAFLVFIMIP